MSRIGHLPMVAYPRYEVKRAWDAGQERRWSRYASSSDGAMLLSEKVLEEGMFLRTIGRF
jgi:hypothetical protein